jgi:hypothetical protein
MLLNDPYALEQHEPLIGPLPHGLVECDARDIDVPDCRDRPSNMQRILVSQLHAIVHVVDVVEVRVRKLI